MNKKNTTKKIEHLILNKKAFSFMLFLFLIASSVNAQFVHPGLWHKKSDLDRMKYMVEAGVDPWISSYNNLIADSKSSFDYVLRKDPIDNTLSRENPVHQRYEYESDALAAYQNSLMWYITADPRHAEKAIEILNAWSSLVNFYGGGTEPLCAGLYGAPLINAAEIIKSTYSGWAANDIQAFKDMLVYPGYSNTTVPQNDIDNDNVTFYWRTYMGDAGRHGNQGLLAWRTVMAIGVFLDNEIIYDRALRQIKGLPHRTDDLPYPSGPGLASTTPSSNSTEYFNDYQHLGTGTAIADYGYDDQIQHYIYDNGQCQESSRDQGHSGLGVATIGEMMEVVWNQGEDLYSFLNDRFLLGSEFTAKYNLSILESYPDQTTAWEPPVFYQYKTRTGRWQSLKINPWNGTDLTRNTRGEDVIFSPVYEMSAAHYEVRESKNNDALWTIRARDYAVNNNGYEKGGATDSPGWGGLTFRRPINCAGDPISGFETNGLPIYAMNVVPNRIQAENFDFFSGNSQGRTYNDATPSNTSGAYRTMDNVDVEATSGGGFNLTSIESGEWVTYTVSVPETAVYGLTIRYGASQAGGTIKISAEGTDVTTDIAIPYGAPNSTGDTDWKEFVVSNDIILNKGVQSIKLTFGGVSGSFKLDNFIFQQTGIVKQDQTIEFFTIPTKLTSSADFNPNAITSTGLDVTYTSSNTAVATIVGSNVHIVGVGQTVITAIQVGNTYYNAAYETQNLQVVSAVGGTVSINVNSDSYVNSGSANSNFGSTTSMVTSFDNRQGYLKFDLSTVPGPVISAKLRVHQRVSFRFLRNLYDVEDDSWTEAGITWNNKPAYGDERASITTNSGWNEWDVSSYTAQEYNGDKTITYVLRDPVGSANGIDFYSKEFSGTTIPELVIEYSNTALSVKEENVTIGMYPNPVKNELNISLASANLNLKEVNITVYSINGQQLMQTKPDSNQFILDLSKLSKGVYFLVFNDKSKNITKKIVKQ